MDNAMPSTENNKAKKITTVVIVLIIIGLLGLVAYSLKNRQKAPGAVNTNEQAIVDNEQVAESTDGFPMTFYSYVGTIQKVEDNKIEILALAAKNYLSEDKIITILTNDETAFLQQDKNIDINEIQPGESGEFYKTTPITFSDLKVGDEITAIDHENVRGKTEFTAKRIETTVAE